MMQIRLFCDIQIHTWPVPSSPKAIESPETQKTTGQLFMVSTLPYEQWFGVVLKANIQDLKQLPSGHQTWILKVTNSISMFDYQRAKWIQSLVYPQFFPPVFRSKSSVTPRRTSCGSLAAASRICPASLPQRKGSNKNAFKIYT